MYLCESITGEDGKDYPMVGVLKQRATMQGMKLKMGYRRVVSGERAIRGHEFHYSQVIPADKELPIVGNVYSAKGVMVDTPVFRVGGVLASYVHFYWGECGVREVMSL